MESRNFIIRNLYRRVCDGWNRPIAGVPGPVVTVIDRISYDNNWTFECVL